MELSFESELIGNGMARFSGHQTELRLRLHVGGAVARSLPGGDRLVSPFNPPAHRLRCQRGVHSPARCPVGPRRRRGSDIHDTSPTTRERWPSLWGVRRLRHWSNQLSAFASMRGHEEKRGRAAAPAREQRGRAGAPAHGERGRVEAPFRTPRGRAGAPGRECDGRAPLPFADDSVAQETLRDTGTTKTDVSCLEEDEVSSSETSASSSGSRRLRNSKRNRSGRRRLRRRPTASDQVPSSESVNVVEYSEDSPNRNRTVEEPNPPSDAATIMRPPGLSWKHILRNLKADEIEQVCHLTGSDEPAVLANVATDDASSS
ncbi:unnamed protein product [Phytophthora fragariaefolia]|uniref:Unnamed protein product n=1 Tax=Phytophthora fragariaefolia TaxID=1490495 RepID=A0A9W6TYU8_9STRA|nr:unnamed protein product [Phytophthora fragariaefolia]